MPKISKEKDLKKVMKKAEKEAEKLTQERDERVLPLAQEVIRLMADYENGKMGNVTREELVKSYDGLARQVLQKYLDANIQVGDIGAINQYILQAFDALNTIIVESINAHLRRIQRDAFGNEFNEIDMQKLDELLKRDTM